MSSQKKREKELQEKITKSNENPIRKIVRKIDGREDEDKSWLNYHQETQKNIIEKSKSEAEELNQFIDWAKDHESEIVAWIERSSIGTVENFVIGVLKSTNEPANKDIHGLDDFIKKYPNQFYTWANYWFNNLNTFKNSIEKNERIDFTQTRRVPGGNSSENNDYFNYNNSARERDEQDNSWPNY